MTAVPPHLILGVAPDASAAEIVAAYRRRSLETHPDRPGGDAESFRAVRDAYELLHRRTPSQRIHESTRVRPVMAPRLVDFGVMRIGTAAYRAIVVSNAGPVAAEVSIGKSSGQFWSLVDALPGEATDVAVLVFLGRALHEGWLKDSTTVQLGEEVMRLPIQLVGVRP